MRTFTTLAASCTFLLACGLAASAGHAQVAGGANIGGGSGDPFANMPATLTLTGTVRDFHERSVTGGHPDFERQPTGGFGVYAQSVADELDADRKPVFRSTGVRVSTQWRDSQNRNIMQPRPYIATRTGDQNGALDTTKTGSLTTAANFAQWFRDVPSVNVSKPLAITLRRQANSAIYVFDDKLDPAYNTASTNLNPAGFFPINNDLLGNSRNGVNNYHFTYELNTNFVYRRGTGQVFTFTGDDDVWVYIDNKLVIDLGGVHAAVSQTIDLDRLTWLQDGQSYDLRFFFAERHRTQSNFRISTTLQLRTIEPPQVASLHD